VYVGVVNVTVLLTDQPLSLDAAFRGVLDPACGGTALFVGAVYLAHRVGVVGAAEPSVIVAASAPHRAEAFAGCRELIDELKATVPIWKKERWAGGGEWMGVPDA
jgi:molybdopterin synthase catalytic subunit